MSDRQSLIDQLAEQVAEKVMVRLNKRREVVRGQDVRPAPAEVDLVEVTFLRLAAVSKRVGLSRSTIYTKMNEGKFPASVKLGARCVAWCRVDVEEWEADPNRDLTGWIPEP